LIHGLIAVGFVGYGNHQKAWHDGKAHNEAHDSFHNPVLLYGNINLRVTPVSINSLFHRA
jgi:hypothetical protein